MYRLVLLYLLLPLNLSAQWLEQGGGRYAALGYGGSALGQDLWQAQANPAGLAGLERPAIGAAITQHFLISELSRASLVGGFRFQQRHHLAFVASTVGFAGYRETLTGITYAIDLKPLSFGVRASALSATFAEYGNQAAWLFDFGLQYQLFKELRLGLWAINPARTGYPNAPAKPSQLQFGLAYTPGKTVSLLLDGHRLTGQPWSATVGLEYTPSPTLPLRLAVSTQPLRISAGLGIRWQGLSIQVATGYQSQLGTTPTVSVDHQFIKAERP